MRRFLPAAVVVAAVLFLVACSLPDGDEADGDKAAGGSAAAIEEQVEEGELAEGDAELKSGELVDEYRLEGVPGQHVRLRLSSPDFDTYLVLVDPDGRQLENDDDEAGGSTIETRLELPGDRGSIGPVEVLFRLR